MSKIFLRALWLSIVIIPFISFAQTSTEERLKFEVFINNHEFSKRKPMAKTELKKLPKEARPDFAYEQDYLRTLDPATGKPEYDRLVPVFQQTSQNLALVPGIPGAAAFPWVERGPNNVGGRTRALAWDPNTASGNKVWAGGVTGGLWFNNDITSATSQWQPVNNFWDNIAVTCIAFDPNNTQIIYVGTGESFTGASRGAGIWKSTDGGINWSQITSTSNFYYVNDIVVRNESGTSTVYAAVDGGFYQGTFHGAAQAGLQRSTNGGNTWTQVLPDIPANTNINFVAADIEIGADNRIWIGTDPSPYGGVTITDRGGGRILYSDAGDSKTAWTISHSVSVSNARGRVELACAPSNANVVYGLVENNRQLEAVVKTTNKGTSWTNMAEPNDDDNGISASDFTRGQATYDLIAAVDPNNANSLIVGGINLHRTTDGASTWSQISKWSNNPGMFGKPYSLVHADQHAITYKPGNSNTVIFGTDGGVFFTNSVNTSATADVIAARNNGYNVTQYYACAISPTSSSNHFLAGSQDNGTQEYTSSGINSTTAKRGGDGAFCFIDQNEPNIQIASYVYNTYNLYNGIGNTFSGTILNDQNSGSFINVADYDDNQNALYSYKSTNKLYRVRNITSFSPGTVDSIVTNFFSGVTAIKVSPHTTTSTKLFVGTSSGRLFRITNANTNAFLSVDISNNSFPNGSISSIEFGATENLILVTISNYGVNSVWYTTNGGTSWASKEGNLPDMPIRWGMINSNNANEAIVATEVGIWSTSNLNGNNPNWVSSNSGLANVRVDMLQLRSSDNEVIAATHGRGLFSSGAFNNTSGLSLSSTVIQPNCGGNNGSISITPVGGSSPYSYTWNTGDTTSSLVNLGAGTYRVTVQDSAGLIDSLTEFLNSSLAVTSFPYAEGFEAGFGLFYNDSTNDDIDWESDFNGTPSGGTGPTGPSQGNFYIRIEGSAPPVGLASPGDEAILMGPCVDLSGASNPFISFDNHQWSQLQNATATPQNCALSLQADTGNGNWFTLFSQIGDQGNQWNSDTVSLSNFIGKSLTLRFVAKVADLGTSTFRSDIALDRIYIEKTPPIQISSSVVSQPVCGTTGQGSITVNTIGGQGTISYAWSNNQTGSSISNLTPGAYSVTVTDGSGGSDSALFEIYNGIGISSFPYSESFEKSFGNWFNSAIHQTDWFFDSLKSGSTPGTGPSFASNGNYFLRIESSLPPLGTALAGDSAMLISNCFDLSGATGAFFAFDNHQWSQQGAAQGNPILRVQVDSSGTGNWQTLFFQQGNQGNIWNSDTVDLSVYHNKSIRIRINVTTGTTLPQNSDIGLDNFYLSLSPPLNITPSISGTSCAFPNSGSISLNISGGVTPYQISWSNGDSTTSISGLAQGNYSVTVTDQSNQTYLDTFFVSGPIGSIANFPYAESFENSFGLWLNDNSDDLDWQFDNGPTPTGQTGPSAPSNGSFYIRIEASAPPFGNASAGDVAHLISPCVDLSGATTPYISFDNHQWSGTTNPTLTLAIDSGDGIWNTIFTQTGNQGNQWNSDTIFLNQFIGKTVVFRFTAQVGTNGNVVTSDIGLDNIFITKYDPLTLTSISTNAPSSCSSNDGSITLSVSGGQLPYTINWADGDTNLVRTGLSFGNYQVSISDGLNQLIDTTIRLGGGLVTNFPYSYDWENGIGDWVQETVNDDFDWTVNSGGTPTGSSGPFGANTGLNYIFTEASAPRISGDSAILYSPCFDLSNLPAPSFNFEYHMRGNSDFTLQIFADSGDGIWNQLFSNIGNVGFLWNFDSLELGDYIDKITRFKIKGILNAGSGSIFNGDMAIDQITIDPGIPLQITSLNLNNATCNGINNGSIQVFAEGGYKPYTYLFDTTISTSNSVSNLSAGTVLVTVIDKYGRTIDTTVTIGEDIVINIATTVTDESCGNAGNGSIVASASGSIFVPYSYNWSNNVSGANNPNLSAGPYTVVVTDLVGCTATKEDTVGVGAPFQISISSKNEKCAGLNDGSASVQVTGVTSNLKYNWSNNDTTATISGLIPSKYVVSVTDNSTCLVIDSVEILPAPNFSISLSATNVSCKGDSSGSVNVNIQGGVSPYNISWSTGQAGSLSINNLSANLYSVIVIDDSLCSQSDFIQVTEPLLPLVILDSVVNETCFGAGDGGAAVQPTGGVPPYQYAWPAPIPSGQQFALGLSSGPVTVTVSDSAGCVIPVPLVIGGPPQIIINFDSVPDLCSTSSTLNLNATPAGGSFSGPGVSGNIFNPANAGIGSISLKYNFTNTSGCSDSASQLVKIDSAIVVTQTSFSPICQNANTLTLSGGLPLGGNYFINGVANSVFNPSIFNPGSYNVKYEVSSGCGVDSAVAAVQVLNTPTVNAGLDQIIAAGTSTQLNGSVSAFNMTNVGAVWQPDTLVQNPFLLNTNTINLIQTSGLVLFAADTLTGCFSSDTVLINVTTTPLTVNVIAGQDSVCEGASVVLSATASGGTGNYSYSWSPINFVSPSNVSNPAALVNSSGYYKVVVSDGFSVATDSVFVTALPKPNASLNIATTYCESDSGIVLNGGSPSGGFYLVNGTFSATFSPVNFGVSQQNIGYQVTNSFGCYATAQQLVDIISSPSATLSSLSPICSNAGAITLTGGSPIGGTYKGNGVSNGMFDPTQVSIGNHSIKYVYTAGSCSDSAAQNILVEQAPSIFAGNDTAITSGGTITFNTTASGNNLSYSWSPSTQLVSSNIANPTSLALTNTALFNVTVVDGVNNCSANDDILVSVVGGPLAVNVTASATTICFGDSVTLNALPSGGTGSYTYQWSNSTKLNNANILNPIATIDSSTQFFVTVSDGVNNAISSIAINVNPLPNVSVPAFADVCEGDAAFVLPSGTPNGGTFTGIGINSNVFDPAAAGVGVHPIVYSFTDANGCSNSASSSIKVNGNPQLSISNSANICDNQSPIGLNVVSPSGGSYSGLGITNGVFNPSIGAGNYPFTYNYVDSNLCSASLTDTLMVNASPIIDAGINQVVNTGFNTQFFASVTSPANGYTSSWSPTNFVVSPNDLVSQVAGITVPTLYTLTVTDTNSGCVSTDQMSISVIGGPLFVSLSVDNDTICEGDTVNFNSLSGGGTGIYSYSWNTTALSNDTIGNPYATPTSSTTYIVTLDDTLNSVSDTIDIVVLAKPQTQFSLPSSICSADNPILLNQGLPAGGAYFGNGVSGNFFDPVLAGNGTSKVFYSLTTPNGCSSLDSSIIAVNPTPANVSLALVTSETCKDGNSFLLSGGAPSGGSYSWLANQNNLFNPSGLSAGKYSVSYQITNVFGCSAIAKDSVNVLPTPTISLLSLTNVTCNGSADGEISVALSGGTQPYKTIIWSTGTQTVTTLSGLAANSYSIFVGDSFSCSASQSYQITEPNQIVLTTSTNDILCNGENNGVASVIVTGGNPPISFAWSNNKIGPQIDSLANGFYTVTATDAKGCSDNTTVQIFEPNKLNGFLSSFPVSCFGKNDGSTQVSVIGGTTPYSYLWESGAQTSNATKLSGGYQTVTVTDTNNCSFIDSVFVQEPPKINIGIFAIGNTSFCAGGSVFLNANPTNYPTYQWKLNGVNISSATAPVFNASLPGNYSVSATDSVGCSATSTVTQVTVAPQPQIVFTGVASDYCENGDTVLIFASPSGGIFKGPAVSNNVFIPNQLNTGTYQLKYTVTDTNGCTDSANKRVDIRPAPQIGGLLGPTMVQPGISYTYAINATNGSQYFWSATNGVIGSTTNNLSNITWGTAGTGEIQVVESNFFGCLDTAKFFISIGIQIGTEELVKTSEVRIYPNPAEDQINLVFETIKSNNGIVNVYANDGRLVFNKTINASQLINGYSLDVSTWSSGIYLVTLHSDDIIHKIPLVIR